MSATKSDHSKDLLSRWLAIVALLLAVLSFFVDYSSFSFEQKSRKEERLSKVRDTQTAQHKKVVTLLSEYKSHSYLYFFEKIGSKSPDYHGDRDARHAEYHKLNAELGAELLTLQFYWGACVRTRSQALQTYLTNYQWESIIQSADFAEKLKVESDSTSLISREIFVEQYDYLCVKLGEAMTAELSIGSTSKQNSSRIENTSSCDELAVELKIESSKEHVKTNEDVTFSVKLSDDNWYRTFDWWSDEGNSSNESQMIARYSRPGKKTINVQVLLMPGSTKMGERLIVTGAAFARKSITVE